MVGSVSRGRDSAIESNRDRRSEPTSSAWPTWPSRGCQQITHRLVEGDEPRLFDRRRRGPEGFHSDLRGLFRREPVDAGGDGWERDTTGSRPVSYLQAAPVARGQEVSSKPDPLSPREHQVLKAAADGSSVAEIASGSFYRKERCGITSHRRYRNSMRGTGSRRSGSPSRTAGCERAEQEARAPRLRDGNSGPCCSMSVRRPGRVVLDWRCSSYGAADCGRSPQRTPAYFASRGLVREARIVCCRFDTSTRREPAQR